jgi:hypothetical protein
MAKKQNYGFDKRRKEQDRKAKKDAKVAERRQRNAERAAQETPDADPSVTPDAGTPGDASSP